MSGRVREWDKSGKVGVRVGWWGKSGRIGVSV